MNKKYQEFTPKVNCQYGAPMGRGGTNPHNHPIKCKLRYIPFPYGDAYDPGGAYWGLPANLWCVKGDDYINGEFIEVYNFYRASSREDAKRQALKDYPNIRFYR